MFYSRRHDVTSVERYVSQSSRSIPLWPRLRTTSRDQVYIMYEASWSKIVNLRKANGKCKFSEKIESLINKTILPIYYQNNTFVAGAR